MHKRTPDSELIQELAESTPEWYDLSAKTRSVMLEVRKWQENLMYPEAPRLKPAQVFDLDEYRQRRKLKR
jgi:hypothetical protein